MAMYDIGRVCLKMAGRDAGRKCVIVDVLDANTVLIDGETRRRKCNVKHLEPLAQTVELKEGASAKDVAAALKKLGIAVTETKPKKAAQKPKAVRKKKAKPADEPKKAKPKAAKKAEPVNAEQVPEDDTVDETPTDE